MVKLFAHCASDDAAATTIQNQNPVIKRKSVLMPATRKSATRHIQKYVAQYINLMEQVIYFLNVTNLGTIKPAGLLA